MDAEKRDIQILRGSGEWSALYVDGKLVTYGDHYIVGEAVYAMFDIQVHHDDTWHRQDGKRGEVAQTLDEVERFRAEKYAAQEKIRQLRKEADELEKRYR